MKFKYYKELHSLKNIRFIDRKKKIYKKQIIKFLNEFHNINNTDAYWSVIIDYWLSYFLFYIQYKINTFGINKNLNYFYLKKNNIFFNTTEELSQSLVNSDDLDTYVNNVIKSLFKKNKFNGNFKKINKITNITKTNFYYSFISKLISLYIFFIKPMVIVEGYFGYKNSIRIFLRSFGKILIIPRCLLFNYGIKDSIINYDIRNKIKVNEKDLFDRIFNNLLINFIPKSFLENYDDIKNKFLFYINNITKLGSATLHYINDDFNIFLAEFKKKKKNFYIFQHGAYYGLLKYDLREVRDRQVAFKTYYWNNKKGLGFNYLTRFKKISSKYLVNNNKIIYFAAPIKKYGITSILMANADYSADQDGSTAIKIFNNLNNKLKPEYLYRAIKISLHVNSLYKYTNKVIKNIRKHKINLDRNLSSKISFNEAKIIILDNFSTAFYECIYIGTPVIVITDINKFNFKEDIKNIFIRLKDKGLIYDNPESAAIFLNENYDNLINWWNNLFYSKLMKELKVLLFHEDKDFCRKIVFELKK